MDPKSVDEWMAVAKERLEDARAVNQGVPNSVGAAYLAGYGVECGLKAYLDFQETAIPKGRDGHDLLNLMRMAGLQLSRAAPAQDQSWLIENWSVDWRYRRMADPPITSSKKCVEAAGKLQAYVSKLIARQRSSRTRR
ncbi:MAG: hypothetical protein U5S82_19920 [Gammaproteobacteria bacterium]|nr:hypothetical protein [Gammaproteobacteria bacterium]